ncbi:DEAD/DEAH box helicase [Candidatus Woesearchaeota archaeon]|nr:DEAD/DEAH box helicase [Candidatus Woesearchaeota archaeon]
MELSDAKTLLPAQLYAVLEKKGITTLRPCQEKAINAGVLNGKSVLVCSPTGSGKTQVAEYAALTSILTGRGKAIYIVPLRALAAEKFKEFTKKYSHLCKIAMTSGDLDSQDNYLAGYDFIICTAEKLDSLLRHHAPWTQGIAAMIVDEIHLLHDTTRGPTLEILMTLLRDIIPRLQIVGLSATIGNPEELAAWLQAELVFDTWRPVPLKKGIYLDGKVEFY